MGKIPKPAQYLMRIDDLCPTMDARRWERVRALVEEFRIRPILAVIPANKDPKMRVCPPDPEFWAEMRRMEAAGATVALHGYRHLCLQEGRSMLRIHRRTEFSGVRTEVQRAWIHAGLELLREKGLTPRLFVAPQHGFDANTLAALRGEGIRYLSDGLARVPFRRGGVTWIPQQLWSPVEKQKGLWTICVHPHTTYRTKLEALREFLGRRAGDFTCFERVTEEFEASPLGLAERGRERLAEWRVVVRRKMLN